MLEVETSTTLQKSATNAKNYFISQNARDSTKQSTANTRLMRCNNKKCKFDTINRDKNASRNIAKIGLGILYENKRPEYMKRPPKDDADAKKKD